MVFELKYMNEMIPNAYIYINRMKYLYKNQIKSKSITKVSFSFNPKYMFLISYVLILIEIVRLYLFYLYNGYFNKWHLK
jgi:hypothetical protein